MPMVAAAKFLKLFILPILDDSSAEHVALHPVPSIGYGRAQHDHGLVIHASAPANKTPL
jgi:hypothetical protein